MAEEEKIKDIDNESNETAEVLLGNKDIKNNYLLTSGLFLKKMFSRIYLFIPKGTYVLILLFCFIFFPGYFIFSSLNMIFKSQAEDLKQSKLLEINEQLEILDKYSNNKRYFHFLLKKMSQYAQKVNNPKKYLEASINNLKKKYPGKIEFVVWNEKGKIINELTDRSGYSYILGKLYISLKEVTETINSDSNFRISDLESIKKNLKIFRNFLGRIFIAENLRFPLIKGRSSGPLTTEIGHGLTSVWYSIDEKISFLCFISDELLSEFSGLEKIIERVNSKKTDLFYGFSISPNYSNPISKFPENFIPDLTLALTSFENAGDSIFENDRALIKMSMPQPEIRTFCYVPKIDERWNTDYKTKFWFYLFCSILLGSYCFAGFWFLYKKHFFSIRWKLTILFLIANLAPILVLGFIAKEYLQSKRFSLENEVVGNLEKTMRELDARYTSLIDNYTYKINKIVSEEAKLISDKEISKDEIERLQKLYNDFNCSEFYLIASNSGLISVKRSKANSNQSLEFIEQLGQSIVHYSNKNFSDNVRNDMMASLFEPHSSELVRLFYKNLFKVCELTAADIVWIYYSYILGDRENYKNNYLLMLMWDKDKFKNLFLKESFSTLSKMHPNSLFYTKSNTTNFSYGSKELVDNVNDILDNSNLSMLEKTNGYTFFKNKKYIYVCLNGNNLKDWVLLAFYPEDSINKEINLMIVQIVAGTLLSLLLTIIIGHILSLQFLKPIHDLGEATLAIGERNFAYRVPVGDKDEFGHLNQVFNRVIEGLGDFEVARIIQESLFPGNNFDVGNFKIFGRSVVMTTLGGDYYDCFKINEEYQGIIIGDVAGHGIPAGLLMAMAKSAVLTSSEEIKLDPAVLTARLHKMFHSIKNERLKRMMTFQYFVLRVSDGHFIYTNAGHCFPVLVDSNTKTAEYIEYASSPLGITAKCRCKNQEMDLQVGQSLILYTDGIVEANSSEGEQYGYNRFQECLPKHYDPNPETFYYNIYNKVYKEWTPKPDDDLTLIIINRN